MIWQPATKNKRHNYAVCVIFDSFLSLYLKGSSSSSRGAGTAEIAVTGFAGDVSRSPHISSSSFASAAVGDAAAAATGAATGAGVAATGDATAVGRITVAGVGGGACSGWPGDINPASPERLGVAIAGVVGAGVFCGARSGAGVSGTAGPGVTGAGVFAGARSGTGVSVGPNAAAGVAAAGAGVLAGARSGAGVSATGAAAGVAPSAAGV
jgi:hypothetical protein